MEVESLPQIYENIWKEVKREPSEILSVDLASLSRAYLAHLEALVPGNLEKAGEYLRLTSYLVYLKSKLLLPQEKPSTEEHWEDTNTIQEFTQIPWLGKVFEGLDIWGHEVFGSPGLSPPDPDIEGNLNALITALLKILDQLAPPVVEVKRLEPLFQKMVAMVTKELENRKKLTYNELTENLDEIIEKLALFLAILELSFREFCRLIQNLPWGEIEILLRD